MFATLTKSYVAVNAGAFPSAVVGNPTCLTGGATVLIRLVHIAYCRLWEMFKCCIVLDCRIFVSCVDGASNTAITHVLWLDPTERQRSFQSLYLHLLHLLLRIEVCLTILLPDFSHRTEQAFRLKGNTFRPHLIPAHLQGRLLMAVVSGNDT